MKKKVIVLVPVNCAPKVVMMTLGSWLEATDGSYEAEVILGVHENYHHYHNGLQSIVDMPVRISRAKEIGWFKLTPEENLIRYSKMHSVNLKAMLEMARGNNFDRLAILDHDLVFKKDFIGYAMGCGEDLVGSYMDDRIEPVELKTGLGLKKFAPKFSIWHLVMTARFYQKMMLNVGLIYPEVTREWFYDTFTRVMEANKKEWNLPVKMLSQMEIGQMIEHRWSMSFNFGPWVASNAEYTKKLAKAEAEYDQRFPNGIGHLFERVGL